MFASHPTTSAQVFAGWEMRSPFVMIRHEAPTHEVPTDQDFDTTGGPVRLDGILRCIDDDGATRVSYEFALHGPFAGVMAARIRRGMPGNLANVKRILEEQG